MADEQAELNRIFKRFDLNGDGKISAAELGDCLKTLGSVTAEEVKRMMAEIDTDGDGSISYQEFLDFAKANSGLMKDSGFVVKQDVASSRFQIPILKNGSYSRKF
ncbi:hypothetical protein NC652_038565 [Populus alba x Populus x berolinensis]|nr:hypothetical protein NC651_037804 [Populus alba x Populus x berolinensis]KAJ6867391.1 hypothetical protein NC652_038565 [Populus alba x Populus x berolinensis]